MVNHLTFNEFSRIDKLVKTIGELKMPVIKVARKS